MTFESRVKKTTIIEAKIAEAAKSAVGEVESVVGEVSNQFEEAAMPVRKSILKRFPTLFLLAVTIGVVAISTGIEHLLLQYDILQSNPWHIFWFGIALLTLTGTLYRKLG